jgi:lipopolysaccharide export system protein LptC
VRILRIVLPLIMVAVVASLAGLVISHAVRRHAAAHKDAGTPIRMTNPHFFGRDNQGRAFTLGARQAARDERSFQTVLLQYPTLTLDSGGPHPSTLTADAGIYHEDSRMLLLKGNVRGDSQKTSRFATDEALVNTRSGAVTGPTALAAKGEPGDLNAKTFDVFEKGDRVIFKGGVHARLNGH